MSDTTTSTFISGLVREFESSLPAAPARTLLSVENPASNEEIVGVPTVTASDMEEQIHRARLAFAELKSMPAWDRSEKIRAIGQWLRQEADTVARVLTLEQGKPLREARGEVLTAADYFDWYADEARRIYGRTLPGRAPGQTLQVLKEPVGPVAAFTAWNFPILLASRKIAAAFAAGCPVLLKPSSETPLSGLALLRACAAVGLPQHALQVSIGNVEMISSTLMASRAIKKVSITGAVDSGRKVVQASAQTFTKVSLELGGHAPVLVFSDADLEAAARDAVAFKFRNAGQVCTSPTRFFVHADVVEEFTELVVATASRLRLGEGLAESSTMGPLANARRVAAATELVEDAVAKGARVRLGGKRSEEFPAGYFFEPTVLTGIADDTRILTEEPFAPILNLLTFTELDEVIERANATDFALAGYAYTASLETAHQVATRLEVGTLGINTMVAALPEVPFGGNKDSGYGREGGSEGIDDYLITKFVNLVTAP